MIEKLISRKGLIQAGIGLAGAAGFGPAWPLLAKRKGGRVELKVIYMVDYHFSSLVTGDGLRIENSERFSGTFPGTLIFEPEEGILGVSEPDPGAGESLISDAMKKYYTSPAYLAFIRSVELGNPKPEPPQPKAPLVTKKKDSIEPMVDAYIQYKNVVRGLVMQTAETTTVGPPQPGSGPAFSFEREGGALVCNSINLHLGGTFQVAATNIVVNPATGALRRESDVEVVEELSFPSGEVNLSPTFTGAKPLKFTEDQVRAALQSRANSVLVATASCDAGNTKASLTLTIQLGKSDCGGSPSGGGWCSKFPDKRDTSELSPGFQPKAIAFLNALRSTQGVSVSLGSCRRPAERAYLMHWAWMIANEGFDATMVPKRDGVDICWVHRQGGVNSPTLSAQKAMEMVNGYRLAYRPSLTSRHISGDAIDMTISWSDDFDIKDASGHTVHITGPTSGAENEALFAIGASYGAKKLVNDAPHWSIDGS